MIEGNIYALIFVVILTGTLTVIVLTANKYMNTTNMTEEQIKTVSTNIGAPSTECNNTNATIPIYNMTSDEIKWNCPVK